MKLEVMLAINSMPKYGGKLFCALLHGLWYLYQAVRKMALISIGIISKGSHNNIIAFFQQWSRSYWKSSDTSDLECSNDGSLQIAYPKIRHGGYKNVEYNGMHSARHAAMINWYKVLMGTFLTVDKM